MLVRDEAGAHDIAGSRVRELGFAEGLERLRLTKKMSKRRFEWRLSQDSAVKLVQNDYG